MTRINLVPPEELCDQHLLAEHRELTRIPNRVVKGDLNMLGRSAVYVLGTGHVRFFYDKLLFLMYRYDSLCIECSARGFNIGYRWPDFLLDPSLELWNNYKPTAALRRLFLTWKRSTDL